MKPWLIIGTTLAIALPAQAQQADGPLDNLFGDLRRQLGDLTEEVAPLMEEFNQEVVPLLEELTGQIKDLNAYHPPEVLPNGDIIIRRKLPDQPGEDKTPPERSEPDATEEEPIEL